ncbi:MAG: hypothetical protein RBS96_04475 [Dehalococcoidales bacterium]|nr:hypothetical protein [Dehalococcoidales bacterium]MDX9803263.1 hypothetical protein [Dehalococcoidales bacterium]
MYRLIEYIKGSKCMRLIFMTAFTAIAVIAFVIWLAFCFSGPQYLNPVSSPDSLLIFLWIGASMVEAGIITFIIWRLNAFGKVLAVSFALIFFLNLLTIWATNEIAWWLFDNLDLNNLQRTSLVELFPLVVESVAVGYLFNILFRREEINKKLGKCYIVLIVLAVNLVTFFIPYVVFEYFL